MSKVQPRQPMIVVDRDGRRGTIASAATTAGTATGKATEGANQVLVDFENGERLLVPRDLLHEESDGHYRLQLSLEELQQVQGDDDSLVIPVLEEHAQFGRVTKTNRVQITKTVHERVEVVDEPLFSEEVEIERVMVDQMIELGQEGHASQVHREGDILIIPIVEEVLIVEKRLILREELRVRKLQRETFDPQEIRLRSEQVEVTRVPGESSERPPKPVDRSTPSGR